MARKFSSPALLVLVATFSGTVASTVASTVATAAQSDNPPAEGFNAAASDAKAIEIADRVMASMGGRKNWDQTRYLSWNFLGRRTHVWDKWTGAIRFQQGENLVLMNINTKGGRAFEGGVEVTDVEKLAEALKGGYEAWVNDSYWLVMPYKLKDSGVTLKYKAEGELADGRPADILQLTFEGVGVTPDNKYDIYVGRDTELVEQWTYYATVDAEPRFTMPWAQWRRHGTVMLSGDRGGLQLTDIRVFDQLPGSVFESPDSVDLSAYPVASSGE